jgi:multidrug efflux pump subunit AcrA (membrane-fusion protein)
VYAPSAGRVIDLKARHGDTVDRGQELVLIEDLETQLQADQLTIKIGIAEQRIALLNEQLGKGLPADKHDEAVKERIDQEFELRRALAERDILLQTSRSPRRTPIVSPLAGKVVTFDAQETLLGKTVKPGDPLLRVADVRGDWELEVALPEAHVGPVRAALAAAGGPLDVDFLLSSHPQQVFKGQLDAAGLGGEATPRDGAVVLPARLRISDPALMPLLAEMPVGVELHAKIDCGRRPLGYVWFYEVWEFLYEHLLF